MSLTKEYIDQQIDDGLTRTILKFKDGKPSIFASTVGASPWVCLNVPPFSEHDECLYWSSVVERLHLPRNEFIPIYCQNCYKVVARPESLDDAMKLFKAMTESEFYGKIGFELRDTVDANWGAYFYCQGLKEGQLRKFQIRKMVDEALTPEHDVFLKRSCTENELPPTGMGDSLFWKPFEGQEELEQYIRDKLSFTMYGDPDPSGFHLKKTMEAWIHFARGRGDKSWKKYSNGTKFPEYRKY